MKIVRLALAVLGALVAAYAASDHPLYGGEPGFGRTQAAIAAAGALLAACALAPAAIASRVLLVAVSSLAALAFTEIAAERLLASRLRPIYQADERLIFRFIPGRESAMTRSPVNGGATVVHRINADGFRGPPLRERGSATRVVVYGDSFIHAFYTAEEETLARRLEHLLAKARGGPVEVVNAGVSSYGPDQVSLKMQDELPRLKPDAVVVAIFAGNDYGDLMRNKMFRLAADGRLEPNAWTLDRKVRTLFELSQRESILKRALSGAAGQLRARADDPRAASLEFFLAEAEREYRSFVVDRDPVVTNTHMDYYSADVSLTPDSDSAKYKIALMGAVMARVRDVAASNGVPLTFLFIPHPVDVTDRYDDWRIDRARFPGYRPRNQVEPLEAAAKRLGVAYVSLFDAYRAVDANRLYFHGGDDHWNAEGQRMAAELVASDLHARAARAVNAPRRP